jgi:predicted enzyme related to lactoylglutathione lyase
MVKGVDFVALQTADFNRAMTFYGETLGLPRAVHVPDRGFAEFEIGNLTLSIIDSAKMEIEHHASPAPVALHVDDVAQARTQLEDAGVQIRGDVLDTPQRHRPTEPQGAPTRVSISAPQRAAILQACATVSPAARPYVNPAANASPQP